LIETPDGIGRLIGGTEPTGIEAAWKGMFPRKLFAASAFFSAGVLLASLLYVLIDIHLFGNWRVPSLTNHEIFLRLGIYCLAQAGATLLCGFALLLLFVKPIRRCGIVPILFYETLGVVLFFFSYLLDYPLAGGIVFFFLSPMPLFLMSLLFVSSYARHTGGRRAAEAAHSGGG